MVKSGELKLLGLLPGLLVWLIALDIFPGHWLPMKLGGLVMSITELGIAVLLYLKPPNEK